MNTNMVFMYTTLYSCPILMKLEFFIIFYYYYLLKLSFHSVAVVLTLVQTKQVRINIHKRNNTKTEFKEYKAQKIHKYTDFKKSSNIKFHENPVGTALFLAGGRTDMKVIVAIRNVANGPK